MAQTKLLVRGSNGVSYAVRYTITATDVTNGGVIFDFRKGGLGTYRFDMSVAFNVLAADGTLATVTGLTITFPLAGQVSFAGTFVAGQVISAVFQANPSQTPMN